jgi:hypothetical protein
MSDIGVNRITAGYPGERPLFEATHHGFTIRQLADDPLALRISIGEARSTGPSPTAAKVAYVVYRGDPATIKALLRRALAALEATDA